MLVYIQAIISIILCFISTITDCKEKKIFNKVIILFLLLSLCFYIIFFNQIENIQIRPFCINLLISLIISFVFFYFKIWSAGDAKLFCTLIFMIPYELYEVNDKNVFPALYLLIIIFSSAFIYVFFETLFLWIKDSEKFKHNKLSTVQIKEMILYYFMGYFISFFISIFFTLINNDFVFNNEGLLLIINVLLLFCLYRIINTNKKSLIFTGLFGVIDIIFILYFKVQFQNINYKLFFIVIAIIIFRNLSEKYNYKEILIEELKPRMILSYGSVLSFYASRIKGLPKSTTENTDSRITEEEVESIKRWSKTKKGSDKIVVVRFMPFAPFIFVGELIFFIYKLFL